MTKLSTRVQNLSESLTLAISAKARSLKAQGIDVVGFGAGEPDFDTPEPIKDAARAAIDRGFTKYTAVGGTPELKAAIAGHYRTHYDAAYEAGQIVVGTGAKQCLYNLFQALLDAGDEVIIPTPCWTSYPEQVRLAGGVPVMVGSNDDFSLDLDAIRAALTERSVAILVNTPSNPTGAIYLAAQLEGLAAIVRERGLTLISDEIYEHLVYGGAKHVSPVSAFGLADQAVVVSGVSKTFAMTGWRIGYALGPAPLIGAMTKIQSQSTSNPGSVAQVAAQAALEGDLAALIGPMLAALDGRRTHMIGRLRAIDGIECNEPAGAFYAFPKVSSAYTRSHPAGPVDSSTALAATLLEAKQVALVPGAAFEADAYIRLSYATSMANIDKGLDRLAEFFSELS